MALSGSLKEFSISDILQLVSQQQKTGVLHLAEREQEVHISFHEGLIIRAECATRKKKELLGDMLARAGLVTEEQVAEALEEQKRTLKKLGDILVAHGWVEKPMLREVAQLQTCETIYRICGWKNGTYHFEPGDVEFDPESSNPVRAETVLMEGVRRMDEWPKLRRRLGNSPSILFEKVKDLPPPASEGDELDAAFQEVSGSDVDGKATTCTIGPNERRVLELALARHDLQAIIDRSRLGEFEACRAVGSLIDGGFLWPKAPPKKKDDSATWLARYGELALSAASKLAAFAVLFALVGLFAAGPLGPFASGREAEPAVRAPGLEHLAARAQLARLEFALSIESLRQGKSPASLAELGAGGILPVEETRYPWGEGYYYRKTDEASWALLPPLP